MDDIFDILSDNFIEFPSFPKNPFLTFKTVDGEFDIEFDGESFYNKDLLNFVLDNAVAKILSIRFTTYAKTRYNYLRELFVLNNAFYLKFDEYDEYEKQCFLENDECFELIDGSDWNNFLCRSWLIDVRFWDVNPTYGVKYYLEIDDKIVF